jgi:6,7-dimethyl-8-ribityllumazine synthase
MQIYEGRVCQPPIGGNITIIAARFNKTITQRLLDGAVAKLRQHNVHEHDIRVIWVPGSYEIPFVANHFAKDPECQAIICLGAVIKGETSHDQHINRAVSLSLNEIASRFGTPVIFGVLTCDTVEQAIARSGGAEQSRDKAADPTVVHKTDRGLVKVGLESEQDVRETVAAMVAELGEGPAGHDALLVQPQIDSGGVELAFGVVRDPSFGPLVMVAAGGVAIDVWADRVFLMPPFSRGEAARALRRLRIWPLLAGHRGSAAADIDGLEKLLLGLGSLSIEVPELAELDLNPVIALPADSPRAIACVDIKLRLAAVGGPALSSAPGLSPS